MSEQRPRVSIGLPVFNGENFLQEAIDSILAQDFTDFELILSDNASTDATEAICRAAQERDARVRYERCAENQGAAWNYNFVFREARGEYFKWAAHDDVCAPQLLRKCVEVLDSGSDSLVLVYPRARFIDDDGAVIRDDPDDLHTQDKRPLKRVAHVLANVNLANAIFGLMRRDALARTRLIDSFVASDYVLFAELAILGEFRELPEQLFYKREHRASSRMANATEEQVLEWFDPQKRAGSRFSTRQKLWLEYMRSARRLVPGRWNWLRYCGTITRSVVGRRLRVTAGRYRRSLAARFAGRSRSAT